MSEFKVGDEFWVIKTYSYHSQPQSPGDIYLEKGIIEIDGDEIIGVTEYTFLSENDLKKCFRSKQEAIDAMIAGLNQLKEEEEILSVQCLGTRLKLLSAKDHNG